MQILTLWILKNMVIQTERENQVQTQSMKL